MNKLFVLLFFFTILCGCKEKKTSELGSQQISKPVNVKTMVVESTEKNFQLSYSGTAIPTVKVSLSFLVPGTIVSTKVDIGDFVKKGQVLAELDKTSYEGTYNGTLAMQKQAQDAYNRLKKVYDKGSLAEIKWEEIKSKLEQANSSLSITRKNLANCTIKAPSDGIIGSKNFESGSNLTPGLPVFDLVRISDVYIKVSVPENEINLIQKNQSAKIKIPALGHKIYKGKVEKIGILSNYLAKTYEVKLRVHNSKLEIKPGMICDIELMLNKESTLITIPYKAITKNKDDLNYVFIVNKESNLVCKRKIQIGRFINNQVEIVSGISVGDILVVEGQHKLFDQTPITPLQN